MSENSTLIVTAVPDSQNMEAVQEYLGGVMPLFMEAGGKLQKRLKVNEVIKGNPSGMVLVMDFESAEVIQKLFGSEEYQKLVPVRDQGFKEMNILVCQGM
ncbi:MAG: DUF1330 domain-containing protein [Leptospiraceae bacterium]|nr:DUF1330 domain-containing protein [Myxococcales bacterium]MCP5501313.1 DUF1330 domain-containing protein [Leptospiraceae bacterium]